MEKNRNFENALTSAREYINLSIEEAKNKGNIKNAVERSRGAVGKFKAKGLARQARLNEINANRKAK